MFFEIYSSTLWHFYTFPMTSFQFYKFTIYIFTFWNIYWNLCIHLNLFTFTVLHFRNMWNFWNCQFFQIVKSFWKKKNASLFFFAKKFELYFLKKKSFLIFLLLFFLGGNCWKLLISSILMICFFLHQKAKYCWYVFFHTFKNFLFSFRFFFDEFFFWNCFRTFWIFVNYLVIFETFEKNPSWFSNICNVCRTFLSFSVFQLFKKLEAFEKLKIFETCFFLNLWFFFNFTEFLKELKLFGTFRNLSTLFGTCVFFEFSTTFWFVFWKNVNYLISLHIFQIYLQPFAKLFNFSKTFFKPF